jgi:3-(3-hydroxy-phenyl)propionate hydroxylase
LQMKYKPMPRYVQGAVTGVDKRNKLDPVGRMFPQPFVGTVHGRVRLDEALGSWFAVLMFGDAELDTDSVAWWRSIGARIVRIGDESADEVIVDADGALARWHSDRPGCEVVVLRPDRYVASVGSAADFAVATDTLRAAFGPNRG